MSHHSTRRSLTRLALVLVALFGLAAAACGDDGSGGAQASASSSAAPVELRLGYFPNLTHAPALIGVEKGLFAKDLASNVKLSTKTFNAGPEAVEALFSGALDATYIGPGPAINAFAKSDGAIRIISGVTSGGAALVVKPGIDSPADLKGRTLATPQLGNTQDVALRSYLKDHGLSSDTNGGGDVSIKPQANADALTAFKAGTIDGAWVPEPFATRMILEGGGKVLEDEADLWPGGKFVTTHLIVRTEYLDKHPDVVKGLLQGNLDAIAFANDHPDEAKAAVNAQLEKITGQPLAQEVIDQAWKNLTFTDDPVASSLAEGAKNAVAVGLLKPVDLGDIYDLALLNDLLQAANHAVVEGL